MQPASQNPFPIYDQNMQLSLPYLWPDKKFWYPKWADPLIKTLLQTCLLIGLSTCTVGQTDVKGKLWRDLVRGYMDNNEKVTVASSKKTWTSVQTNAYS